MGYISIKEVNEEKWINGLDNSEEMVDWFIYNHYKKNPQYRHKFYEQALLYDISSSKFGDGIKPGTFVITDSGASFED